MRVTKNIGDGDRVARLLIGVTLGFLFMRHVLVGATGLVLAVIAVLLLITALAGWSPLYRALRISTREPGDLG